MLHNQSFIHSFQSQLDEEQAETEETTVKKRSNFSELHQHEDLNRMSCYSVGMVMKHRKYNYYCVIYGWDPICKATKVRFFNFSDPYSSVMTVVEFHSEAGGIQ